MEVFLISFRNATLQINTQKAIVIDCFLFVFPREDQGYLFQKDFHGKRLCYIVFCSGIVPAKLVFFQISGG